MTRSFAAAQGFLPAADTGPGWAKFRGWLKSFLDAAADGLDAQHTYRLLTARGVPAPEAAKAAFARHLARK